MSLFVGHHLAKTGGTTVLYHLVQNLTEGSILHYGPNNASERAFSQYPIISDEPVEKRADYSVMFGHGIKENAMRLAVTLMQERGENSRDINLFTVLREPFALFRSTYSQAYNQRLQGQNVSPQQFLQMRGLNPVSTNLWVRFGWLVGGGELSRHGVYDILSSFRNILLTEDMANSSRGLVDALGLPLIDAHRRPTAQHEPLDGVTPEMVLENSPLDLEIWQALSKGHRHTTHGSFEYDEKKHQDRLARITPLSRDEEIDIACKLALPQLNRRNKFLALRVALENGYISSVGKSNWLAEPLKLKTDAAIEKSYRNALKLVRNQRQPEHLLRLASQAVEHGVSDEATKHHIFWARKKIAAQADEGDMRDD